MINWPRLRLRLIDKLTLGPEGSNRRCKVLPTLWPRLEYWVSNYCSSYQEQTKELRFWYYTRIPIHYDSGWCFLRIWVFCFQWL